MSMPSNPFPLDAVTDAVLKACTTIMLPYFRGENGSIGKEQKADKSVVTKADKEMEAHLTPILQALDPASIVIGEESTAEHNTSPEQQIKQARAASQPYWTVDPIDGTLRFVEQSNAFRDGTWTKGPRFGSLIAYVSETMEAAWAVDPIGSGTPEAPQPDVLVAMFDKTSGTVRYNGQPLEASDPAMPLKIALESSYGYTDKQLEQLVTNADDRFLFPKSSIGKLFMLVENVNCAGVYHPACPYGPWDVQPLIITNAARNGATPLNWHGTPFDITDLRQGLILSPADSVSAQVMDLIEPYQPERAA